MYKVILADDEPLVLYKEKSIFNWEEFGFKLVGQATNSDELLKLINDTQPDAVFTDINMPSVSGLNLIHQIRKKKKQITFVIISGYSDFKYAQSAIREGVFDYLTKPITQEVANTLLDNLREHLDEKYGLSSLIDVDYVKKAAFKELVDYINEHFCEKLYLNELAEKFDINMTYCCHLFKKNFNCSFSQYILKCRMEKAAKLLLEDNLSVMQISDLLGYDYYHFNKVFKRHYSVTPKQYKFLNR